MSDDRTKAGSGPDDKASGRVEGDKPDEATKTQDLTKAGRQDFDPDAGTE